MDIAFTIPTWLLWFAGTVAAIVVLFLAFIGVVMLKAVSGGIWR